MVTFPHLYPQFVYNSVYKQNYMAKFSHLKFV